MSTMIRGWEYDSIEVISLPGTDRLNRMGHHGWELVSTVIFNGRMYHYLKREKNYVVR